APRQSTCLTSSVAGGYLSRPDRGAEVPACSRIFEFFSTAEPMIPADPRVTCRGIGKTAVSGVKRIAQTPHAAAACAHRIRGGGAAREASHWLDANGDH